MKTWFVLAVLSISNLANSQFNIRGTLISSDSIDFLSCRIGLKGTSMVVTPSSDGHFSISSTTNNAQIQCFCDNSEPIKKDISFSDYQNKELILQLVKKIQELDEIQALGTLKETKRAASPILTDIYDKKYFLKNPSPSIIDVMDRMNGVRAQVNCNVCGTGDIHLNGLEGAYTLVVLDGVPIIGGLSSVYGLSGIPTFMLDRIEITKGPASSLYGSEALGGVIHAFSKKATTKQAFHLQYFGSSHLENNLDLGLNLRIHPKVSVFTTGNYYYFNQTIDQNKDNFTDIPLQNRYSIFQKWSFERKNKRVFTLNARYLNEKRWGGELNWNRSLRGSDSLYAETIDIKRLETNLIYQLPLKEKFLLIGHWNKHLQDSYYGLTKYDASQNLFFGQLTWNKDIGKHQLMLGLNSRNTTYDDNTFLTQTNDSLSVNKPLSSTITGLFAQNEYKANEKTSILISTRVDYYETHGFILTPRLAFSRKIKQYGQFRFHTGTGFRVVNLFSEDHAALTGSRIVEISEKLNPERSLSFNTSYSHSKQMNDWLFEFDLSGFYTYFYNRIVPDYLTDATKIIYSNLNGYGESVGGGFDIKLEKNKSFSFQAGMTMMEVSNTNNGVKALQLLTEKISGNWTLSYYFKRIPVTIDYTGNFVGPMKLPLLSSLDPRPEYSKTYSIQNIQVSYQIKKQVILFVGIKNLLNWTPAKNIPFLIARTNDPFDKQVNVDANGVILPSTTNPYALSFDPAYVYAPNQGIRAFFGLRCSLEK